MKKTLISLFIAFININAFSQSQWITASSPTTAITYTVGSVGIGTTSVTSTLDVKAPDSIQGNNAFKVRSIYGDLFTVKSRGLLSAGNPITHNLFLGLNAGNNAGVGIYRRLDCIGIGEEALYTDSSGTDNIAIGYGTMRSMKTGSHCVGLGTSVLHDFRGTGDNVGVGTDALFYDTTGFQNVSVGSYSGFGSQGNYNVIMGYYALAGANRSHENTVIGMQSYRLNPSGGQNTGLGSYTGYSQTTGSNNVMLGFAAGKYQTNVTGKIYIGGYDYFNSVYENNRTPIVIKSHQTDSSQTEIRLNGFPKIVNGTQGDGKVLTSDANGIASWQPNTGTSQWVTATTPSTAITYTVGAVAIGTSTVGVDYLWQVNNSASTIFGLKKNGSIIAGLEPSIRSLSVGQNNGFTNVNNANFVALGVGCATNTTTGINITAVGVNILNGITSGQSIVAGGNTVFSSGVVTGSQNTAWGSQIMTAATSGFYNCLVGSEIMQSATSSTRCSIFGARAGLGATGDYNSAFGFQTLYSSTGGYNSAFGVEALYSNSGGIGNTALGAYAGRSSTGTHTSIFLGYSAGFYNTDGNRLFIDNTNRSNAQGDKNGAIIYGTMSTTPANQILVVNGKLYMKDTTTPFHYYSMSVTGGAWVLTDTGSADAP